MGGFYPAAVPGMREAREETIPFFRNIGAYLYNTFKTGRLDPLIGGAGAGGGVPNPAPSVAPTELDTNRLDRPVVPGEIPFSLRSTGQEYVNPEAQPPSFAGERPSYLAAGRQPSKSESSAEPRMRAIRKPGGGFLFTNRPELGGEEVDTRAAGREMRMASRSAERGPDLPTSGYFSPSARSMRDLVSTSLASTEGPDLEGGREYPGGYGGSPVAMTPELRRGLEMRDVLGLTAMAQARQGLQAANMPIERAAAIDNPQIQTMIASRGMVAPELQRVEADYGRKRSEIMATIKGEKEQRRAIGELDVWYEHARKNILDSTAAATGRYTPQY